MNHKKCHFCNKPAVGEIQMCINGHYMDAPLCEDHMLKVQKDAIVELISIMFSSYLDSLTTAKQEIVDLPEAKIKERACPECFEILKTYIHPMLNAIHNTYHVKRPKQLPAQLVELEQKLKDAVQREQYETAAKLKAELDKLKNELGK